MNQKWHDEQIKIFTNILKELKEIKKELKRNVGKRD